MATTKRIYEIWSFYVNKEPSNEHYSIEKFKILRKRFNLILKATKLRSILLAMGTDMLPIQNVILSMTDEEFEEFIADDTSAKKRKEIYGDK